jgi:hypothetical protein
MMTMVGKLVRLYELGNRSDSIEYDSYVDSLFSPSYSYTDDQSATPTIGVAPIKSNRRVLRDT